MTLKGTLPVSVHGTGSVERKTTRQIVTLQHDNFHICQPLIREISAWFGIKKKVLLVHRTAEGRWDIKQVEVS